MQVLQVNGMYFLLQEPVLLEAFLEQQKYDKNRIVVELNGKIVSKAAYAETVLTGQATLEIVTFVGGG